jgi:hypothetical protein
MSTNSYTTLDDPLATNGAYNGYNGTYAWGIDGNNIVGQYTTGTSYHGFLYNINTNSYTTLDDPCRVSEYLPRVLSV